MGKYPKVILVAVVSLLTGLIVGRLWPRSTPVTQPAPECDPFTRQYTGDPPTKYYTGDPPTKYYTGDPHPTASGVSTSDPMVLVNTVEELQR